MPLPPITPIDIAGGSTAPDLETVCNSLIDQRIVSATPGYQSLVLVTDNGSTVTINFPAHTKGIISGLTPTRTGALNYDIAIGSYQVAGEVFTIAAPVSLVCAAPDATMDRYDLIVGDDSGTLSVVPGTPSATPAYPSIAANETILHIVGIPAATSEYGDSVVVSHAVDTPTIQGINVNPQGQVSFGGLVRSQVPIYTSTSDVDLTTTMHCVDTSGGSPFVVLVPDAADAGEIEGVQFAFFDEGSAATDNWEIRTQAGTLLATATTNNQVIRLAFINGNYKIG